jgi:uncharacterized heparinase superfamily protein
VPNRGWQRSLHGFRWLRHMRAAGTELAAANARALVSDWIALHGGRISGIAWEPATTAKRVIAWLQHSTVVLQGAEFAFYRAFPAFIWQCRSAICGRCHPRCPTARTGSAPVLRSPSRRIVAAGACLGAAQSATRQLAEELDRQILPDGGHISRNPMAVLEMLADLLPLRHTYANQAEQPPPALINARRAHAAGPALLPPRQDGSARPLQRHGRDHP